MRRSRFNRFELKYGVPARIAERLTLELLANMTPDPEGDATGAYAVTSLYYDTRELDFFRAKKEGIKFRRKLRVRRYGPVGAGGAGDVAVEIKQRINRTTQKRRVELPLEQALALCSGESIATPEDPAEAATVSEIEFLVRSLSLQPVCAVGYQRQAFRGSRYEPGLRVTLDRSLWVRDPSFGLHDAGPRHVFLPAAEAILEVKANEAVPLWTARMLASHGVELVRYSKYCQGVRLLRSLPGIDARGAEKED